MLPVSLLSLATLAAASPLAVRDFSSKNFKLEARQPVTEADIENFSFYAEHSGAAYCNIDLPAGTAIKCGGNCPDVEANEAKITVTAKGLISGIGAYVSIDEKRNEIVVAVRGSSNLRNWIANVKLELTPTDIGGGASMVHGGFLDAWNGIKNKVLDGVRDAAAKHPHFRIITTGHSLGGAVATLGAASLREAGHKVDIYTYGAPRVGNGALVDFITDQPGSEYRVTHKSDPVPRLPPIFLGYRHTSPEYWLSKSESNEETYPIDEIQVCEGNSNVACNAGTFGLSIAAHSAYFGPISDCTLGPAIMARAQGDDELEAKVNAWVEKDLEFINNRP